MQALQHAFINCGAFQCGFCTPGMLVAALALLRNNPRPSADDFAMHFREIFAGAPDTRKLSRPC